MFNTVNQGQSVTNNYGVVQIGLFMQFATSNFNKKLKR